MDTPVENLIVNLWALSRQLGDGGGLVNPSIYDTAQCALFYPAPDGGAAAIEWLRDQQQPDGGFGDPSIPMARDVPTWAAALALKKYGHTTSHAAKAAEAALSFLKKHQMHHSHYQKLPLPDDIPIGVELVLPQLLRDAENEGVPVDWRAYEALTALGLKRRELIFKLKPGRGSTAVHSWEAWGAAQDPPPDPNLFDESGSVGHSPAATAVWLHYDRIGRPDPTDRKKFSFERLKAISYLKGASEATGLGIPGVFPTSWPIDMFEILFVPYALLLAGLLDEQPFKDMMKDVVRYIEWQLKSHDGLGFSRYFTPDGDDTAAGIAVLHVAGRKPDLDPLKKFDAGTHFYTWKGELQPSLSATARAVHALALIGKDVTQYLPGLIKHQRPDGRWIADKWNASWLYTTCHVLAALAAAGPQCRDAVKKGVQGIMDAQRSDGGWGVMAKSTATETAYAVLGLLSANDAEARRQDKLVETLRKAEHFLTEAYPDSRLHTGVACWIAKEIYRPLRIDRAFEIIALLALKRHSKGAPLL